MPRPKKVKAPEGADAVLTKPSRIHKLGLFAKRAFEPGERVIEFVGDRVGKREFEKRSEQYWEKGHIWMFELSRWRYIDGSHKLNKARWANHSCDPNCEVEIRRGRLWYVATRPIQAGEELTIDYNLAEDDDPIPCRCGAANCRGRL